MNKNETTSTIEEEPIARAFDNYLYPHDLNDVNYKGLSKDDSTLLTERFIKNWVQLQVIVKNASEKESIDFEDIEQKAKELKHQLITYEFEKSLIETNLDTLISEEEIKVYYDAHQSDFELQENIFKGYFVKLHKGTSHLKTFKKHFYSTKANAKHALQEYCVENADIFILNDSSWVSFGDISKICPPLKKIKDEKTFLKESDNVLKTDKNYYYYLKILDHRFKNEISPLQFHKKEISNIIYNKRKLELIKKVEEKLYKEALNEQDIEYFK